MCSIQKLKIYNEAQNNEHQALIVDFFEFSTFSKQVIFERDHLKSQGI